ncbi:unnamed protein product [Lathyrus oleraceus]|uniref:Uncharacterized protein n=1 Tax=Pisum sativum TaxID=3888 RepID=A0A9D4VIN9_PEA|nr:hypothetical protein KIW84_070742 [Pisum sativum]
MASAQCYKSCEQSCQHKNNYHQQQQHSSIGHKVTDFYKGHHNDGTNSQCYSQTEVIYQPGHASKYQSNTCNQTRYNHTATGPTIVTGTTAAKCQGRNRRERRNMFQRMKDGISGHSSDSGSSSDECDSDNENRRHRKYCN